jgi:hypothetical protein
MTFNHKKRQRTVTAPMSQPVKQRGCEHGIPERFRPPLETFVRDNHDGGFFVKFTDPRKEFISFNTADRKESKFVDNQ